MPFWSRIINVIRGDRVSREIDEELQSHIAEAIEQGRDPSEARRAFGPALLRREESRDIRLIGWLDSLRADAVFGWRQLLKRKATSGAAILSLALAIGACTSAFRLIDAMLLRPLPVAGPERLHALYRQGIGVNGQPENSEHWTFPTFRLMRAAVKGQAELLAISYAERRDLTYRSDEEVERAEVQFVSGWMFDTFGLRPALGRLLTENDDVTPGAHPYAVLSHDYWTRRFGQDSKIVGRTFRMDGRIYEIVGVGPERFTGTETGTMTGIFVPATMHHGAVQADQTWLRIWARLPPGVSTEPVRSILQATHRAFAQERARGITGVPRQSIDRFIDQTVMMESAAAGISGMQKDYRRSLIALAVLVALVLLIACANVANLMTAQAAARAREMALRVSIGAGRARLMQLVLVESALLAFLAAAMGAWFAWWSAPFVVSRINPPDNPARLYLPADWRVLGFGLALTIGVMFLFGLAPALRASAVRPANALKGGSGPHSRRRLMHALIATQVGFCVLVLFVAGLFTATFSRLANRPTGFSAAGVLIFSVLPEGRQPPAAWDQLAAHLRTLPGVEKVALAGWALLGRSSMNDFISIDGASSGPALAYFMNVSPGWAETMRIPVIDGRDFLPGDTAPGAAIVNETFAKQFLNGRNPIGRRFDKGGKRYQIVGLVGDAPYRSLREPILPVAYVPFHRVDALGAPQPAGYGAFIVRTSGSNLTALASLIKQEVARTRPEFRVIGISTQEEIIRSHTVRERLLAMLASFFATIAILLAGVGLYGVLDYSVLERRREIGIRMAIGAQPAEIARRVTAEVFRMVLAGGFAGLALGMTAARYIEALLYQVKPGDPAMLALPSFAILAAALLAACPAVMRAVSIDPAATLRSE